MLEVGEFDKLINTQTDALRGNPVAMRQAQQEQKASIGKGITPPLLKALALQKVASETAAAENQLKLSMQQNPATVVEQLEQNATARTQDDLLKQTAGIMGERNKRRQQQMSPAKPPQQVAQGAPQGLAGAPRPPMQMAQGGIIGYAAGGITDLDVEKWLEDNPNVFPQGSDAVRRKAAMEALTKENTIERKNAPVSTQERAEFRKNNPTVFPKAEDSVIDKIIQEERFGERTLSPEPIAKDTSTGVKSISDAQSSALQGAMGIGGGSPQAGSISGIAAEAKRNQDAIAQQGQQAAVPLKPGAGVLKPGGIPSVPDMGGAGVMAPPVVQPPAGFGASSDMSIDQQLQSVLNTPAPDTSAISKKQLSTALGDSFMGAVEDRIDVDPKVESEATLARLASDDVEKGGYGVKKYEAGLGKYLADKEALDKAQLDPEAVAMARANAGVSGLISGGTSRGSGIARDKFDANVAKRRRDVITEQRDMYVKNKEATSAILDKINAGASDALKLYKEDVSRGMDTMANITKGDMTLYQTEADRMYNQNQNGIKNKIDALKVSSQANLQKMIQEQASLQELSVALKGLINANTDLRTEYFKALGPEQTRLNLIINNEESTPAAVKLAQGQLKAMEGTYQALEDKARTDDIITIYEDFIKMLRDQGGYSNTMVTQLQNKISQSLGTSQGTSQGASQSASKGGTAQQRADIIAPPPTD